MENFYSFAAIRGVQAGRTFYVAMIRFKLLGQLLAVKERQSRSRRASAIAAYLRAAPFDHLLPPLTITVSGDMRFDTADLELRSVGRLSVDVCSRLSIVDGRQRVAGIARAIALKPSLGDESIAATMVAARDEAHQARLRDDLNRHGSHSRLAFNDALS